MVQWENFKTKSEVKRVCAQSPLDAADEIISLRYLLEMKDLTIDTLNKELKACYDELGEDFE